MALSSGEDGDLGRTAGDGASWRQLRPSCPWPPASSSWQLLRRCFAAASERAVKTLAKALVWGLKIEMEYG